MMKTKRFTALVIAGALMLSVMLTGCGPKEQNSGSDSGASAITSTDDGREMMKATLFLPDEQVEHLQEEQVEIEALDSHELIETLVLTLTQRGALPEGTAVLTSTIDKNGDGFDVVLDLNEAFGSGVQSTGTAGEMMIIGSLVNSLWSTMNLKNLTLTVEGEALETGHNIYDEPFTAPLSFE